MKDSLSLPKTFLELLQYRPRTCMHTHIHVPIHCLTVYLCITDAKLLIVGTLCANNLMLYKCLPFCLFTGLSGTPVACQGLGGWEKAQQFHLYTPRSGSICCPSSSASPSSFSASVPSKMWLPL